MNKTYECPFCFRKSSGLELCKHGNALVTMKEIPRVNNSFLHVPIVGTKKFYAWEQQEPISEVAKPMLNE